MKFLVALSAVLAVAVARPGVVHHPLAYAAPWTVAGAPITTYAAAPFTTYAAAPVSSQYHAQDALGQYSYGYADGLSAKNEVKTADGTTVGAYSYVDAEGKLQSVEYASDAVHGFRVAATNLPVAPAVPATPALAQPVPVVDTPEVAEAKAKHLAALEEAKVRSTIVETPVVAAAAPVVAAPASVVAAPAIAPVLTTPSLAVRAVPTSVHGYSIGYGSLYGYGINSVVAHPAITTYHAAAPLTNVVATAPVVAHPVVAAPTVPLDTPEVAQAKLQHLAAVEEVKARNV